MASVIRNFEISKMFKETEFDARIFDYTNSTIVRVQGNVAVSGDASILNVYYGKKTEFYKNPTRNIKPDDDGYFDELVELEDGNGYYYITVELSVAGQTTDSETRNVTYESTPPLISELVVSNFDSIERLTGSEDIYMFFESDKNNVNVNFTSVNNDINNRYYYKLWLSFDNEPINSIPLSTDRVSTFVSINEVHNGTYYLFLKVIDSAGNITVKKKQININRDLPDIEIESLKIVNENHYLSLNETNSGAIRLLINSTSNSYVVKGELRLYSDNKIIDYISEQKKLEVETMINGIINTSGIFFLPAINFKETWQLAEGDYEVEIDYTDKFKRKFTSNRSKIYVKNRSPKLYASDLTLDNPASLIFNDVSDIRFSVRETFFSSESKQITCKRNVNGVESNINVKNTDWILNHLSGEYETTLTIYFDHNDINRLGNDFTFNTYTFSITNDYGDSTSFEAFLIYKPEKNTVVLSKDFIFPQDTRYPIDDTTHLNSLIEYGSISDKYIVYEEELPNDPDAHLNIDQATLFVPPFGDNLEIGLAIINDVDFQDKSSFKTSGNILKYDIDNTEHEHQFLDNQSISLSIPVRNRDGSSDVVSTSIDQYLSVRVEENIHHSITAHSSLFNYEFVDDRLNFDDFYFVGVQDQLSFLAKIDNGILIDDQSITMSRFNDYYVTLSLIDSIIFPNNTWKQRIIKNVTLKHVNNLFDPQTVKMVFDVYKDLSYLLQNKKHEETVHNDKFNLKIPIDIADDIADNVSFFIDLDDSYNLKDLNKLTNKDSSIFSHAIFDSSDNTLNLNNIILPADKLNGDFIFNVYYKFKDSETVNYFKYFLSSDNSILDLEFYFENNNNILTNDSTKLIINNRSLNNYYIKNIKVYSDYQEIYSLNITSNFSILEIPINKYSTSGTKLPNNIYFDKEQIATIQVRAEYDQYDYHSTKNNIKTFISDNQSLFVTNSDRFSKIKLLTDSHITSDLELLNTKFSFLSTTDKNSNHDYIVSLIYKQIKSVDSNGIITDVVGTTINNYINIKSYYSTFTLSDFRIQDFTSDGLYSLEFSILNLNSNLTETAYFELENMKGSYNLNITSLTFDNANEAYINDKNHTLVYDIIGGIHNNKSSLITFNIQNTETGYNKNFFGTNKSNNSIEIEFDPGVNIMTVDIKNTPNGSVQLYTYTVNVKEQFTFHDYHIAEYDGRYLDDSTDATYEHIGNLDYIIVDDKTEDNIFTFFIPQLRSDIVSHVIIDNNMDNPIDVTTLLDVDHYKLDLKLVQNSFYIEHKDKAVNFLTDKEFIILEKHPIFDMKIDLNIINNYDLRKNDFDIVDIYCDYTIVSPQEFRNIRTSLTFKN